MHLLRALPLPSIANYGSFMEGYKERRTGSLEDPATAMDCIVELLAQVVEVWNGSGSTIWRLSTWRAGKPAAVLYDFLPQSRRHPFYTDVPPSVLLLYNPKESNIMASYWNKSYNELPKGFYTARFEVMSGIGLLPLSGLPGSGLAAYGYVSTNLQILDEAEAFSHGVKDSAIYSASY